MCKGDDSLKRVRCWSHRWVLPDGGEAEVRLSLDENRVQHFRNLNRIVGEPENWRGSYFDEFAAFWVWKGGDEEISELARQLEDIFRRNGGVPSYTSRAYAEFIKQFVASFPYEYDDRSIGHMEYGRFPIETLYDGKGDCECLSFLLASLFAHAGFKTAMLGGFTKPGRKGGHAAVGLAIATNPGDSVLRFENTDYVYCEAVSCDCIGVCDFDFAIFSEDAEIFHIPADYHWSGTPHGWVCSSCCSNVEPWRERCPSCGTASAYQAVEQSYRLSADWDEALRGFLAYTQWLKGARLEELAAELRKLANSDLWGAIPSGNKAYLEKALIAWKGKGAEGAAEVLEGARRHLLSAWPHVVASAFCHKPDAAERSVWTGGAMSWIGMGVYEMTDDELAKFARRVLSDTICARIAGFSSGSRLAIGRILDAYERKGEAYLSEKRGSIENILVKVVIPQVFTVLAREEVKGVLVPQH